MPRCSTRPRGPAPTSWWSARTGPPWRPIFSARTPRPSCATPPARSWLSARSPGTSEPLHAAARSKHRRSGPIEPDPAPVAGVRRGILIGPVARRISQPILAQAHHVSAEIGVVRERVPRQRVIALAHAEPAAEAHDRIGDLPRALPDHEVVDRAEALAAPVVDGRTLDLVGGDQVPGLVRRDGAVARGGVVASARIGPIVLARAPPRDVVALFFAIVPAIAREHETGHQPPDQECATDPECDGLDGVVLVPLRTGIPLSVAVLSRAGGLVPAGRRPMREVDMPWLRAMVVPHPGTGHRRRAADARTAHAGRGAAQNRRVAAGACSRKASSPRGRCPGALLFVHAASPVASRAGPVAGRWLLNVPAEGSFQLSGSISSVWAACCCDGARG